MGPWRRPAGSASAAGGRFDALAPDLAALQETVVDGAGDQAPAENPLVADPDWPFQQIDHVLVRCGEHGGPTLPIRTCRQILDDVPASDHYGLLAELG
jgi:endonuclease/exonuclease/phosphatase family metal-dependent hydrolase